MNSSKKKNLILVIAIICFGLMLTGGTYAYLTFGATVINSVYNTETSCFLLDYTDEGVITGTLLQSSTPNVGLSGSVSIKTNEDCSVPNPRATIKLNVNDSTSDILLSDGALKYAVYANSSTVAVSTGVINTTGDIVLYENFTVSSNEDKYTVFVWLDGNIADSRYINLSFSGYIYATATQGEGTNNEQDNRAAGLYDANGNFTPWDTLVANGDITLSGTMITDANDSLTGELIIENDITTIENMVFFNCRGLTSVVIPASVTSIGNNVFDSCTALTSVVISGNVTSLSSSLFFGCINLTSIVMPESITSIGNSAFYRCDKLSDVYYGGTDTMWSNIEIGSSNDDLTSATIHYNS